MRQIQLTIEQLDKEHVVSDAVNCMVSALEYRDPYTKGHSQRVGELAEKCGKLICHNEDASYVLKLAGQLHDIGKIGVADNVLFKEGRLTDMEWREMKRHPAISADIVSEGSHLSEIAEMVRQHHERWDGNGYPDGIKQDEICLGGRILAFCDALDAMASNRPYRDSLTWEFIEQELHDNMGSQFDPKLEPMISQLIEYWQCNYENETNTSQKMEEPMLINNLKDQHTKVYDLIEGTVTLVDKNEFEIYGQEISKNISQLAGVLRIHLGSEDRYLYPKMINSKETKIVDMAKKFDKEMGGLSNDYIAFKAKYNTPSKITENVLTFKKEFKSIIKKLKDRLNKEDNELYPLAQSL